MVECQDIMASYRRKPGKRGQNEPHDHLLNGWKPTIKSRKYAISCLHNTLQFLLN